MHIKNIDVLRQLFEKNHAARDQALLTLSSAALALTLTVFDKIFIGLYPWLLYMTWGGFTFSILVTLYSFNAAAKTAELLEIYYHDKTKYQADQKFLRSLTIWYNVTNWLNRLSLIFFTFAILLFIIFSIANVEKKSDKNEQSKQRSWQRNYQWYYTY